MEKIQFFASLIFMGASLFFLFALFNTLRTFLKHKKFVVDRTLKISGIIVFVSLILGVIFTPSNEIECNEFDLIAKFEDGEITVKVKTDLPDSLNPILRVTRRYYQEGEDVEYGISFTNADYTIGQLKKGIKIDVGDSIFINEAEAIRCKMAKFGEGFNVKTIDGQIKIRITNVGKRPGKENSVINHTFKGKRATTNEEGQTFVKLEKFVSAPFKATYIPNAFLNNKADNLPFNQMIVLDRETAVMRKTNVNTLEEILAVTKRIPEGSLIKISGKKLAKGIKGYVVKGYSNKGRFLVSGWINPTALVGQELKFKGQKEFNRKISGW